MMGGNPFAEIQNTHFLAINFTKLQGLRAVPVGLLAFFIALWANTHAGGGLNLLVTVLIALLGLGLYWVVDRYYNRSFGHVVTSAASRRTDWITAIIGAVAGLAAFWLDNRYRLPFSCIGLVIAGAVLADYLRLVYDGRRWYPPVAPAFVLLLALISVLPALGLPGWWQGFGLHSQMLAVFMVVGVLFTLFGVVSHLLFIHALPGETRYE
jgi:hypothetical protein